MHEARQGFMDGQLPSRAVLSRLSFLEVRALLSWSFGLIASINEFQPNAAGLLWPWRQRVTVALPAGADRWMEIWLDLRPSCTYGRS